MKAFYLICCFSFLFSVFSGCTKESQELVLDNAYTISEGGEPVNDYRSNFEGRYLMHCVWDGVAFAKTITVQTMPTRAEHVYLKSLFESGYQDDYRGKEIIGRLTASGVISFEEQVMKFRQSSFDYTYYHKYSKGSGFIDKDGNIHLDYYLAVDGAGAKLCNCLGKKE